MQEEPDLHPDEKEELSENTDEEEMYEGFEEVEEFDLEEMEPDESLEPVGEQSPNTREAFEEEDEDDFLLEDE